MPGLPPVERFKRGDEVVCVDDSHSGGTIKLGSRYTIDADYGDVKGKQLVYIEGDPDNCPWAAHRFKLDTGTEKLTRTEQAVFENLMYAESQGEVVSDNVNLPKHYARFKIEPIRFICENGLNFFQGNIVKYTLRHDAKNGLEDIKKAIRYAQMYFKFLSGDPDWWKAKA